MVLISFWVQVYKGQMVCDCFNLMASTTTAGMLFVCVPMWIDLDQDMWVYLWIFLFFWESHRDSNVEIVSLLEWQGFIFILNCLPSLFNRSWRS